jgi:hypothetical protein
MKHVVMTELDALLDTRLGTLATMNPEYPLRVLEANYRGRRSDEFSKLCSDIDDSVYQELYQKRDREILMASAMTELPVHLNDLLGNFKMRFLNGDPTVTNFELWVNCYPYRLTEMERQGIVGALSAYTGLSPRLIQTVYHPYEEINHEFIRRSEVSVFIFYNYREWVEKAFPMKDVVEGDPNRQMIVPKLVRSLDELKENLEKTYTEEQSYLRDPFVCSRFTMASVIRVEFYPVRMYSLIDMDEVIKGLGGNPDQVPPAQP